MGNCTYPGCETYVVANDRRRKRCDLHFKQPMPPKRKPQKCKGCGNTFTAKGRGYFKYCPTCQERGGTTGVPDWRRVLHRMAVHELACDQVAADLAKKGWYVYEAYIYAMPYHFLAQAPDEDFLRGITVVTGRRRVDRIHDTAHVKFMVARVIDERIEYEA